MTDVVGRPPTPAEELLWDEVKHFAPSTSMERLDSHAKFIFANVGIVATLIGAIDLFKPDEPTPWLAVPVVLAAASLFYAAIALTPKYRSVNIADLQKLRAYYAHLLRTRGRYVRIAGILFALALLTAPFAFNQTPPAPPTPITSTSSVKVIRAAGVSDTASIHVELANVPPGSTLTTGVCLTANGQKRQLAKHESPASGEMKLDIEQPIPAGETVTVTTTVTRPGEQPYTETTTVHIPLTTGGTNGNEETQGTQEAKGTQEGKGSQSKGSQSKGSGSSKGNR